MTMAWLRVYDGILDDPKIQLLSDREFRMLVNLWCLTKRYDGAVPDDMKILTFALRLNEKRIRDGLQILIDARLIDKTKTGYEPHDWKTWQYESDGSSTERVKRFRERKKKQSETFHRNGINPLHETLSEAEPDSEPEAPPSPPPKGGGSSPPPDETFQNKPVLNGKAEDFEAFWEVYPVKKARDLAEKSYLRALSRASPAVLLAAAKRYAAELKTPGAPYAKYPQTWLDEGRWLDATGPPNGAAKLSPEHAAAVADKADKLLKRGKYAVPN
jgi:hypothetical protein